MYLGCVWKWIRSREQNYVSENRHASLYSVKVIKMSRRPIDRLSFHGRFTSCETDRETDCTALLSLDTQDIERGQSSMMGQCFLTAPICSRDGVWNFVSASDKTNTNTPIVSLGEGNHHVIMWSCDHVIMWSYPLSYHSILKNNTKKHILMIPIWLLYSFTSTENQPIFHVNRTPCMHCVISESAPFDLHTHLSDVLLRCRTKPSSASRVDIATEPNRS